MKQICRRVFHGTRGDEDVELDKIVIKMATDLDHFEIKNIIKF